MKNQVVFISIHGAIVALDIPFFLIEKLKIIGLQFFQFSSDICDVARIHIKYYNDLNIQFCVVDNHVVIEKTIISMERILFRLFVEIEDLLMRQILYKNSGMALHGGGVVSNGKAILVVQEKGAGKSTLIAKLAQNKMYRYLSDDLLIAKGKTVSGVPLPMRLRELKVEGLDLTGRRIECGLDNDNKTRYFYMPAIETATVAVPVSTVLVPHYDSNSSNCIVQANGSEKVRIILNHIKRYSNIREAYKNTLLLANSIDIYHLYYRDFSILDSFSLCEID